MRVPSNPGYFMILGGLTQAAQPAEEHRPWLLRGALAGGTPGQQPRPSQHDRKTPHTASHPKPQSHNPRGENTPKTHQKQSSRPQSPPPRPQSPPPHLSGAAPSSPRGREDRGSRAQPQPPSAEPRCGGVAARGRRRCPLSRCPPQAARGSRPRARAPWPPPRLRRAAGGRGGEGGREAASLPRRHVGARKGQGSGWQKAVETGTDK